MVERILWGLIGLGMGNHITTVLLFPVLIFSVFPSEKRRLDWRTIFQRLLWMGIGLLAYISLPLRAASFPKLNWGIQSRLKTSSGWFQENYITGKFLIYLFKIFGCGFGLLRTY